MPEDAKYFYAKFKMNDSRELLENLIISEDKGRIDGWHGGKVSEPEGEKTHPDSAANQPTTTFANVASEYQETMETFHKTVPFMMTVAPMMRRFMDDKAIRQFLKSNAERLEDGQYEVYRVDVAHFPKLQDALEDSTAIKNGTRNLPSLFIVGLVSAYDTFLAKLIRLSFLSKPEWISSSERNISFKDLVEIGSIEAARDRFHHQGKP